MCVRSASTDLCGGCRATGIPTATRLPLGCGSHWKARADSNCHPRFRRPVSCPLDDAPLDWRTCADSNRDLRFRKPAPSPVRRQAHARTMVGAVGLEPTLAGLKVLPRHLGIAPCVLGAGPENRTQLCRFVGPVSATSGVARHGSGGRIRTCASPG